MASVDRSGLERAAFLSDPPRPRNCGIHAPNHAQATEIAIAIEVLNRMLDLGRPESVRVA